MSVSVHKRLLLEEISPWRLATHTPKSEDSQIYKRLFCVTLQSLSLKAVSVASTAKPECFVAATVSYAVCSGSLPELGDQRGEFLNALGLRQRILCPIN